jgi:hypothetical protein
MKMEMFVNFMKINDISNVHCVLKGGKKRESGKTEQKIMKEKRQKAEINFLQFLASNGCVLPANL